MVKYKNIMESSEFPKTDIENIYVISDTHFWHRSVIRFTNRPWCSDPKNHHIDEWCPNCDVVAMNEGIINRWNSVIPKDGIVLHLGDFSLKAGRGKLEEIINRLNGKIYMIRGNHDRKTVNWFRNINIYIIPPFLLKYKNHYFLFNHRPDYEVEQENIIPIFGHLHEKLPMIWYNKFGKANFNVSVEVINYTPIKLGEIYKKYMEAI